jgi:hypothetical protein
VQLTATSVAVDEPPGRTLAGWKANNFIATTLDPAQAVRGTAAAAPPAEAVISAPATATASVINAALRICTHLLPCGQPVRGTFSVIEHPVRRNGPAGPKHG